MASRTARVLLSRGQILTGGALLMVLGLVGLHFGALALARLAVAAVIAFYVIDVVVYKLALWGAGGRGPADYGIAAEDDPDLPPYTVLVPMYHEAAAAGRIIRALQGLVYPAGKLDVQLLLEEEDGDTRAAVSAAGLPPHIRSVVVPNVGPRTKPKALNWGYMQTDTRLFPGSRLVIFDAEDRPDPYQLLRAVAAHRALAATHSKIGCLQASLGFWEARTTWVSSFSWAEYAAHFMWVLGGLDKLGLVLPLGGTSNHFSMEALGTVAESSEVLMFPGAPPIVGPWDAYNVTEDADLAIRLAAAGYSTHMLHSITWEEPPDTLHKAIRQRSRWNKGYFQTGLVWTRSPAVSIASIGFMRWLAFCWLMLATPAALLINPWTWALTATYVVAHVLGITAVVSFIQALFPAPVYYLGMTVALAGNGLLLYQKLIAPSAWQELFETKVIRDDSAYASRLSGQLYGLSFRMLLTPFWWAITSVAAYLGVPEVILPSRRHAWIKTEHGHHQELEEAFDEVG